MNVSSDIPNNTALGLARYLREFISLRTRTIRQVDAFEHVLWFHEIPRQPSCRSGAWLDDHEPGDAWLEVSKQSFPSRPIPPDVLADWIEETALELAESPFPPLPPVIRVAAHSTGQTDDTPIPEIEQQLTDHPEVLEAYERYRPKWEAWAEDYQRRKAIQNIYARLFELHLQLQKRGEIVEVVLGLGLIDWRPAHTDKTLPIRRHAITTRVKIDFDAKRGLITVGPPSDGARLRIEDDMLEADFRPDRRHYDEFQQQLEKLGDEIWDKTLLFEALQTWAHSLSPHSRWHDGLKPLVAGRTEPAISFAPALILRKRQQTGMMRVYDRMIEQLGADPDTVPAGWRQLTGSEPAQKNQAYADAETPTNRDQELGDPEIYFPLPANHEQKRILEAMGRDRGVLVQGPPGTGKSHTIANLICHALATGQRILITAETARALRVLKDKIPEELQPLCVSLLGQDSDANAELNKSVQGITSRHASWSPGRHDTRIAEFRNELDQRRRRCAEIDHQLRELREDETREYSLADGHYRGTATAIARRVADEQERRNWLKLGGNPAGGYEDLEIPPISSDEMQRWLKFRRSYSENQIEASGLAIPPVQNLPNPEVFRELVAAQNRLRRLRQSTPDALKTHRAFRPAVAMDGKTRSDLGKVISGFENRLESLLARGEAWLSVALSHLLRGRRHQWETLSRQTEQRLQQIDELQQQFGQAVVNIPPEASPEKVLEDAGIAQAHLQSGGKWRHFFLIAPKALKGRGYLRKQVLVDGQPAKTAELLERVCADLERRRLLEELASVWAEAGASELPQTNLLRIERLRELLETLQAAISLGAACERLKQAFGRRSPPLPAPDWLSEEAPQFREVLKAAGVEQQFRSASQQFEALEHIIDGVRVLYEAHPVVEALADAVARRSPEAYSQAHAELVEVERTREAQQERLRMEARIAVHAPELIDAVSTSLEDPVWDQRFAEWEATWHWAQADAWLIRRADPELPDRLRRERKQLKSSISELITEVAALRAWRHFFDRLTQHQAEALRGWRDAVKKQGKGTGKSARMARLRRAARNYMNECRDAIPVWILPRYLVAEMIDAQPDLYDMVIADEASQLGVDSLFLFYVAKRIIVVGDDQQISPEGVGVPEDAITSLLSKHLQGFQHAAALGRDSSLYDNARIRFNQNIVLREHFRCVPEIIQFSNDLCYASQGTPLDPLRNDPDRRLDPLVVRHVSDGYRQGGHTNAQNLPEADAIVGQIRACLEDSRYDGKSMGVISLQGETQARWIEHKLLEIAGAELFEERRLICGDAYAFQGDERDVIFLSMVAAPNERIGTLSNDAARRRFNVAASRARDQLWLFHTAKLEDLSSRCMRHALLSYMLDPKRRTTEEEQQQFDSEFERAVYQRIAARGYRVRTQVAVGDCTSHRYRIDLVVEGMRSQLAVECDGDKWHGPDQYEHDTARQRDIERAGWRLERIRGSDFYRDPATAMKPVWRTLERLGIQPGSSDRDATQPPKPKPHHRIKEVSSGSANDMAAEPVSMIQPEQTQGTPESESDLEVKDHFSQAEDNSNDGAEIKHQGQLLSGETSAEPYRTFEGKAGPDPREARAIDIADGLCRIVEIEGPMIAKRAYDVYLRGLGIKRLGGELRDALDRGLAHAQRNKRLVNENEADDNRQLGWVIRLPGTPAVRLRQRGPRDFTEIPPAEIQRAALLLSTQTNLESGSEAHLRVILDFFDLKRMTAKVRTRLLEILSPADSA